MEETATRTSWRTSGAWGHFLGVREGTDDAFIGTEQGVMKARSVKRLPAAMRTSTATLEKVRGVPWRMTEDNVGAPSSVQIERPEPPIDVPGAVEAEPDRVIAGRQMYVTKAMMEEYGATPGCNACWQVMLHGKAKVTHLEVCMSRIQGRLERVQPKKRRVPEEYDIHSEPDASAEPAPMEGQQAAGAGTKRAAETSVNQPEEKKRAEEPATGVKRRAEIDTEMLDPRVPGEWLAEGNTGDASGAVAPAPRADGPQRKA